MAGMTVAFPTASPPVVARVLLEPLAFAVTVVRSSQSLLPLVKRLISSPCLSRQVLPPPSPQQALRLHHRRRHAHGRAHRDPQGPQAAQGSRRAQLAPQRSPRPLDAFARRTWTSRVVRFGWGRLGFVGGLGARKEERRIARLAVRQRRFAQLRDELSPFVRLSSTGACTTFEPRRECRSFSGRASGVSVPVPVSSLVGSSGSSDRKTFPFLCSP